MNKKLVAVVILLTILCSSTNAYASTQTGIPGIKAGDSFSYSITTHWNTTNSSLTSPPEYLAYYNQTKCYNVSVLYAEDADVVAMNFWEFNNNTQKLSRVDMNTGNGTVYLVTGEMSFQGFFPADLKVGDLLRPDGNSSLRINSTELWDYSNEERGTNVVSVSYPVRDYSNSSTGTETVTYYIDQTTGVLVKRVDSTVFPDQSGSVEWVLTATNLWVISSQEIPIFVIALIIAVIFILAGILIFYRGKKKKKP